ncbi:MAG: 2-amino-4-hydroxy-6-hydroxymethyldihydropteridine diphosphokinase [Planctomycetes bacterium]|nr:2-amino-4-hydroxy-6-hydroxymethyldihydropteridine diphosphokinase [Planctomycetota bacterium]
MANVVNQIAYIALGSNLGDRKNYLDRALERLRSHPDIKVTKVSPYEETDPVGGPPGQGKYLNAAAELETALDPHDLLQLLHHIEARLERVRGEKNEARTIDLDLLLHGQAALESSHLVLPHPRMHERLFVLRPLASIAPEAMHPVLKRSVGELLRNLQVVKGDASPKHDRELAGLRALVTGSTRGIGRVIALELAAGGADVLVHGLRSQERAMEVSALCQSEGVRTSVLLADLRELDQLDQLADNAWDQWGGLDICINNAGADTLTGEAAGWSFEEKLGVLWSVDVEATVYLSRRIGARMKEQGRGAIVNIGWDQAETGMEGDSGQLFAASKGAVMAFSKSLALTLAPQVRVNCLAPGWIRTAWGKGASQSWQERVRRETPLGRWGTPEDVARVARWLVSPAAEFITGQVIRINGGAVRG